MSIIQALPYPALSTAERLALTNLSYGYIVYDNEIEEYFRYEITTWRALELIWGIDANSTTNGSPAPTRYLNAGCGMQISFSASANQEIVFNKILENYSGENLIFCAGAVLYSTDPSGYALVLELDYHYCYPGQTTDPYTTVDDVVIKNYGLDGYSADRPIQFNLDIPGNSQGVALFVTFRRKGADAADTYPSTFDVFGFMLFRNKN